MVDILGFHTVSVPMLFIYSNSTNQRMLHLHGFLQLSLESDLERRLTIMDRCFDFLFPFLGPDFLAQMQCAESVELQIAGLLETISKQIKIEGENGPISNYSAGKSSEYHNFRNDSFCTVVTGYWQAEISKYSHSSYEEWLPKTLSISMPYIIFSSAALSQKLLSFRSNNPTRLIEKDVTSFVAKATYPDHWIHQDHMPSATLGIIWLEKMHLLYESSKIVSSEYLVWVDSGISFYRNKSPPVGPWSRKILNSLPKDRMSYSLVSEDYHSFAGTVLIIPRNLISMLHKLFYMEYDICRGVVEDGSDEQKEASIILDSKGFEAQDEENEFDLSSRGVGYRVEATGKGQFTDGKSVGKRKAVDRAMRNWKCGSEQYLWSLIRAKYPTYFHIMSYNYGDIDFLW